MTPRPPKPAPRPLPPRPGERPRPKPPGPPRRTPAPAAPIERYSRAWWRERLPLIYAGKQLVAVGDLWIAAEFATEAGEAGLAVIQQAAKLSPDNTEAQRALSEANEMVLKKAEELLSTPDSRRSFELTQLVLAGSPNDPRAKAMDEQRRQFLENQQKIDDVLEKK